MSINQATSTNPFAYVDDYVQIPKTTEESLKQVIVGSTKLQCENRTYQVVRNSVAYEVQVHFIEDTPHLRVKGYKANCAHNVTTIGDMEMVRESFRHYIKGMIFAERNPQAARWLLQQEPQDQIDPRSTSGRPYYVKPGEW